MAQSKKDKREQAERVQSQLGGHSQFKPDDHTCRRFDDMEELVNILRRNQIVWSWGANSWTNLFDKCLCFKVQGYLFKGLVFVTVNGMDLFDIYYTDKKGIVKFYDNDVYLEDFIEFVDGRVERKK